MKSERSALEASTQARVDAMTGQSPVQVAKSQEVGSTFAVDLNSPYLVEAPAEIGGCHSVMDCPGKEVLQ